MKNKEKYIEIFETFGEEAQIEKLKEEVYEFILALQTGTHKEWTEEYADVLVVMTQFFIAKGLDTMEVQLTMAAKVDRTIDRIESGYYKEVAE